MTVPRVRHQRIEACAAEQSQGARCGIGPAPFFFCRASALAAVHQRALRRWLAGFLWPDMRALKRYRSCAWPAIITWSRASYLAYIDFHYLLCSPSNVIRRLSPYIALNGERGGPGALTAAERSATCIASVARRVAGTRWAHWRQVFMAYFARTSKPYPRPQWRRGGESIVSR